jgi:hypothetical protein
MDTASVERAQGLQREVVAEGRIHVSSEVKRVRTKRGMGRGMEKGEMRGIGRGRGTRWGSMGWG